MVWGKQKSSELDQLQPDENSGPSPWSKVQEVVSENMKPASPDVLGDFLGEDKAVKNTETKTPVSNDILGDFLKEDSTTDNLELTPEPIVQTAKISEESILEQANNSFTSIEATINNVGAKLAQGNKAFAEAIAPGSLLKGAEAVGNKLLTDGPTARNIQGGISNVLDMSGQSKEDADYLSKSLMSGVTSGLMENKEETKDMPLKVAGVIYNIVGSLATAPFLPEVRVFGAGKAFVKSTAILEKTAAPFFGAAKETIAEMGSKITKEGFKQLGKTMTNSGATGAVYGGVIQGIKALEAGANMEDTLANILAGGILGLGLGAVIGAGIHGITEGIPAAGNLSKLPLVGKYLEKTGNQLEMGLLGQKPLAKQIQLTKNTLVNPEIRSIVEGEARLINADKLNHPDAYLQANQAKFIAKTQEINPVIMPWELVARPELLKSETQQLLKPIAEQVFTGDAAPAATIFAKSADLQKMMKNGEYAQALTSFSSMVRSQVKGNDALIDYMKDPLFADGKILASIMSERLLNKQPFKGMSPEASSKLINYFENPSPEAMQELVLVKKFKAKPSEKKWTGNGKLWESHFNDSPEVQPGAGEELATAADDINKAVNPAARKKINKPSYPFKTKAGQKALKDSVDGNIRLDTVSLDNLVSQSLTKMYQSLSDGIINSKNALYLKQFDDIGNALTTFNKPLFRSVAQSFVGNQSMQDVIGYAAPEDVPLLTKLIGKRVDQENLNWLARKRIELQAQLTKLTSSGPGIKEINKKLAQGANSAEDITSLLSRKNDITEVNRALSNNTRGMYRVQSNIDVNSAALNDRTMSPEALAILQQKADSIFLPSIDSVSKKITPEVKSQADYIEKINVQKMKGIFFRNDNPYFVKQNTDLADVLQAMDYSGYDVDLYRTPSISSSQRKFMKEFGLNNIFQTAVFDSIKYKNIKQDQFNSYWEKQLKMALPELKEGNKLDNMVHDFTNNIIKETDREFTSLSSADQSTLKRAKAFFSKALTEKILHTGSGMDSGIQFEGINTVLKRNNIPAIPVFRPNDTNVEYFPFYTDPMTEAKEAFFLHLSGQSDASKFSGMSTETAALAPQSKKVSFQKRRTGLAEAGVEVGEKQRQGAIASFRRYVSGAGDIIYGTDLSKSIHAAADFAPQKLGQGLREINKRYIMNMPHEYVKRLDGKVINWARKQFANSSLLMSGSVLMNQVTSIPLNMAIGGSDGVKALFKMFTPDGRAAIKESTNIALRDPKFIGEKLDGTVFRPLARKFGGKPGNMAATAYTQYVKFGEWLLRTFDKVAAEHAFTTGYQKALRLGLERKEAVKYGDYHAGLLQGEQTKIGQPEFMSNPYAGALMQFQSYTMNMFATLKDDLPMIAKSDGAQSIIQALTRSYVHTTITNSILRNNGLPEAYDVGSMVPMWDGSRGKIPGVIGSAMNVKEVMVNKYKGKYSKRDQPAKNSGSHYGKKKEKRKVSDWLHLNLKGSDVASNEALGKFESDAMSVTGIPGIGQYMKGARALDDKDLVKKHGKFKAAMFGSRIKNQLNAKEEQELFEKNPVRKWVKKTIPR